MLNSNMVNANSRFDFLSRIHIEISIESGCTEYIIRM